MVKPFSSIFLYNNASPNLNSLRFDQSFLIFILSLYILSLVSFLSLYTYHFPPPCRPLLTFLPCHPPLPCSPGELQEGEEGEVSSGRGFPCGIWCGSHLLVLSLAPITSLPFSPLPFRFLSIPFVPLSFLFSSPIPLYTTFTRSTSFHSLSSLPHPHSYKLILTPFARSASTCLLFLLALLSD